VRTGFEVWQADESVVARPSEALNSVHQPALGLLEMSGRPPLAGAETREGEP